MATSQLIPQQQVDIQPNGTSRLYCDFISPGYNCRVWVDLAPFDQAPTVENNFADAWIRMLIFEMMHVGGRFEVKGAVSLTLLRNLEHFMEAWSQMHPEYLNVVDIKPDRIIDDRNAPEDDSAVALFSQGLDATFALYRHASPHRKPRYDSLDVKACLLVQGGDRGLYEEPLFLRCYEKALSTIEELGITRLLRCGSNYPEIFPLDTFWNNQLNWGFHWQLVHLAALTGMASFWQRDYGNVLVGSTYPYSSGVVDFGSNFVTDPLLSSRRFRVYEEGWGFTRSQKAKLVSQWERGLRNLRVCWHSNPDQDNCGVCEKCFRTILNFKASGAFYLRDISLDEIRDKEIWNEHIFYEYQTILEDAEKWGTSQEPWAQALKERLSLGVYPAPKPLTFPQRMGKRIKHFLYYKKEDAASVRIKILGLRIYKRKKEGPLHQSRE